MCRDRSDGTRPAVRLRGVDVLSEALATGCDDVVWCGQVSVPVQQLHQRQLPVSGIWSGCASVSEHVLAGCAVRG
jgi:hypothetical protein